MMKSMQGQIRNPLSRARTYSLSKSKSKDHEN